MSKTCQILKTATSVHIAEYLQEQSNNTICINLDTSHNTFATYKKLDVLNIFIENEIVYFDKLINFIITNKSSDIIIDCGISVFTPLLNYIMTNNTALLLKEQNVRLLFVSIIEGGLNTLECIQDFHVLSKIPQINLIVIDNQILDTTKLMEKEFHETKAYDFAIQKNIVVGELYFERIHRHKQLHYLRMIKMRLIFSEFKNHSSFPVNYLSKLKNELWCNFEQAFSNDTNKKTTIKETIAKKMEEQKKENELCPFS